MAYRHWLFFPLAICCTICVQIDHIVAATTIPPWYCYGDICNINGVDQYCSGTYLKCIDCYEKRLTCFTENMPLNCTNACKEYTLEQLKNYTLEQLKVTPCPLLNGIAHGSHSDDGSSVSYPGKVVSFSCDRGFRLEGAKDLVCMEYGYWSSLLPKCVEVTCLDGSWVSISSPDDNIPVCAMAFSIPVYVFITVLLAVAACSSVTTVLIMVCCCKRHRDDPREPDSGKSITDSEDELPAIQLKEMKHYIQSPVPNLHYYGQNEIEKEALLTRTDDYRRQGNNFNGNSESRSNTESRNPDTGDHPLNGLLQVNLNFSSNNQSQVSVMNAQNSTTNIAPNAASLSDNRNPPNSDKKINSNTPDEGTTAQQPQESVKYPTMETQLTQPKNIHTEGRGATGGAQLGFVQQGSNEQDLNRKLTLGQAEIQMDDPTGANNAPNGNIPPNEIVISKVTLGRMHLN